MKSRTQIATQKTDSAANSGDERVPVGRGCSGLVLERKPRHAGERADSGQRLRPQAHQQIVALRDGIILRDLL